MLILSIIWLLLGAVLGWLISLAKIVPGRIPRSPWWRYSVAGMMIFLAAGWLNTLIIGAALATAGALWMTIVGVIVLFWCMPFVSRAMSAMRLRS